MLDELYAVQAKDLELDGFEKEKQKTPEELIALSKEHSELEKQLTERRAVYDTLRKQVNANELDIKGLSERRKAASEGAVNAYSPKEASQYQNQEMQFATRLQELEEETFPLLERQEAVQAEVEALEEQVAELEPRLAELKAAEEARLISIDESTKSLKAERTQLASSISAPLLKQYEQVRKAKRGVGMAFVVNNQRCGGCNMHLPIHVIQKARKGTGVTRCPSCGRILWAKNAEAEAT